MTTAEHRSGFVAVVGRPNVGKSTLVNALVGHKISIVTSKPHTTRHAILGVLTEADFQIVFIDTPGLASRSGKLINRLMNKAAVGALESADKILFVIEAGKWTDADDNALQLIRRTGLPCLLVINKVDRIRPKEKLLPFLQKMSALYDFAEIVPVSATTDVNVARLKEVLVSHLPQQEALYSAEMLTDRGVRFRVAEILREKLMENLYQEVPYGLGIEINQIEEDTSGRMCIDATIWVDQESHKGIVVGRGGEGIKKVGSAARQEMQEMLNQPVHLESRVKLKKNWSDNAQALAQMGYDGDV
jgi:GTP-binding protein Era